MIEIGICDDDMDDLRTISQLVGEICRNEAVNYRISKFLSGREMLEKTYSIDVGILDISMKDMNGIDLGTELKKRFPDIKLIYTTSFRQYCEKVINQVHAFSFLVKPVSYESIKKQLIETINAMNRDLSGRERKFYNVVTSDNKKLDTLKLKLKDIIYFEYIQTDRTVKIVCKNKWYLFSYTMRDLENELRESGFEVSCRGLLVNMRHIKKIKRHFIYMDNGDQLSLSQKRKQEFLKILNEFMNNNFN